MRLPGYNRPMALTLVTWNFRHIANAAMRGRIERVCRESGYEPPVICTPNELMEADRADNAD